MVRTRQKGKRVVLASMRNGCNRDILNPEAHALDMNVVWLDDHLDELIVPDATKSSLLNSGSSSPVPADVLTEIIAGILEKNGGSLTSRHVGRQLQSTKAHYGSLRSFLQTCNDVFTLSEFVNHTDSASKTEYTVTLNEAETDGLLRDVKLGRTTDGSIDSSNNSTKKASSIRGVAYAPSTVKGEATLPVSVPTAVSDSYFDDVNDDSTSDTDISDTVGTDSDSESSSSDVIQAPLLVPQPQLTEKQLRKQERLQKEQRLREALEAPGWTETKLKMMSIPALKLMLKQHKLHITGRKGELISRLLRHFATESITDADSKRGAAAKTKVKAKAP
eukprot:8808-Heterococcus_DN1.PRE.2